MIKDDDQRLWYFVDLLILENFNSLTSCPSSIILLFFYSAIVLTAAYSNIRQPVSSLPFARACNSKKAGACSLGLWKDFLSRLMDRQSSEDCDACQQLLSKHGFDASAAEAFEPPVEPENPAPADDSAQEDQQPDEEGQREAAENGNNLLDEIALNQRVRKISPHLEAQSKVVHSCSKG